MTMNSLETVRKAAKAIRWNIIEMIGPEQKGHLGGSMSAADIIATLYFHEMRHDPARPHWPERDRLVLSKGHVGLAQYAALAECGYFPKTEFAGFKKLGGMLQGHPDMRKTPGIEASTGSLGQGLSIACGMAAGLRLSGLPSRVFCLVGDGEMGEGQIWEAAMAAAHYRLDNLVAIIDRNRLQAMGAVADRMDSNPVPEKWRAFGWNVSQCSGNDAAGLIEAFADIRARRDGRPNLLVANTVMGAGLAFAEGQVGFHNGSMTRAQYDEARVLFCETETA